MSKWLTIGGAILLAGGYGEVRFNQGFETGVDVTTCIQEIFAMSPEERLHAMPEGCAKHPASSPGMLIRRWYLDATGQAVPSKCHNDGTCTVGPGA